MVPRIVEHHVEQAALAWLESIGWAVHHGAEIAPGEPFAERADYGRVVLEQRLRPGVAQHFELYEQAGEPLLELDEPAGGGRHGGGFCTNSGDFATHGATHSSGIAVKAER